MTLANITLTVFIIISLIIFFLLMMLMRQIKRQGRLPAQKRTILGAILFIPSIILFSFVLKQIIDWRTDIEIQRERAELNTFVRSVYKPLLQSQNAILAEERRMGKLLQKVNHLSQEHPNHAQLINQIIQKWLLGLKEYHLSYKKTDKEIRRAWISYNTLDQKDVLKKFEKQAVRSDLENKKAEKKYRRTIYNIQDELIKSLDTARKLLDANRRPPRSKKQKALVLAIRQSIIPFNDRLMIKLIDFLGEKIDPRLKKEVEKLRSLIKKASQQTILVRNHLQNNPDLEIPLTKTINSWIILENKSREKLTEILYVIEAEYIARSLDLSPRDPAIKSMHKSLNKGIPFIVGNAEKQKRIIDQSYNIGSRYRNGK